MGKSKLDIFDKKHNAGQPGKLDSNLVIYLQALNDFLNDTYGYTELLITSGFRENDPSSQHRLGLAVDVVCSNSSIKLLDFYLAAERFPFTGIGVYPDWSLNRTDKSMKVGGLHLDVRRVENGRGARWLGVRSLLTGKNEYVALNFEQLKKYGVI